MKTNILTDKEILQKEIEGILKDNKIEYKKLYIFNNDISLCLTTYETSKDVIKVFLDKATIDKLQLNKLSDKEYWIDFTILYIPIEH